MLNFLLGSNPATTIIGILVGGLQSVTEPTLLALLGRLTNEVKNYKP